MTEHSDDKTREDASIDYAHYMARGREMRSAAFLAALGKLRRSVAGGRWRQARRWAARRLTAIQPVRNEGVFHPGE